MAGESDLKKTFVVLIQANQGMVNSLCRLYSHTYEEMKDYRQDVLLALWQAYPGFREESKISTWIYRVALNTLISNHRKKSIRIATEPYTDAIELYSHPSPGADDGTLVLQQAIGLLHPLEKAIVILHLEGYAHKEIADLLSLSETNVSTRLNRIKKQLEKCIKTLEHESK